MSEGLCCPRHRCHHSYRRSRHCRRCYNVVMDGRGYGPRRGIVSRRGRRDCRRAAKVEMIKREGYPPGRSSLPSLVGPRQGHLASGAMHPPLLLLHFPRLSLPELRLRLMHHIAPLRLPCAPDRVQTSLFPSSLYPHLILFLSF